MNELKPSRAPRVKRKRDGALLVEKVRLQSVFHTCPDEAFPGYFQTETESRRPL